jgi:hypothetical protein
MSNPARENKMVVKIGWNMNLVLPIKDAIALMELLSMAEVYESKYDSETKATTHYVYSMTPDDKSINAVMMGADLYNVAKLAGKPQ